MWPKILRFFCASYKVSKESYLNFVVLSFSQGVEKLRSNLPSCRELSSSGLHLDISVISFPQPLVIYSCLS